MQCSWLRWNSGFLALGQYPHFTAQDDAVERMCFPSISRPLLIEAELLWYLIQITSSLHVCVHHKIFGYSLSSQCVDNILTCPDIFSTDSLYNLFFKILFLGSQGYIIYLMTNAYKPTNDPNVDTFKVQYLLAGAAALAIIFPYKYIPSEILWAFSIWLEAVAILPQLFMLQRTGEAETITTHYLFALGAYRALYIPNWIYRYFAEPNHKVDYIAITAGIIQTILYSDFFYVYYTKVLKGKKFKLPV